MYFPFLTIFRVFQEAKQRNMVVFKSKWINDCILKEHHMAIENYILRPMEPKQGTVEQHTAYLE